MERTLTQMIGYRIEITHPFSPRKRILATVRPEALTAGLLFQRGELLSQVFTGAHRGRPAFVRDGLGHAEGHKGQEGS